MTQLYASNTDKNRLNIMFKRCLPWFLALTCILVGQTTFAEDGYEMWLRYPVVADKALLKEYRGQIKQVVSEADSPTLRAAAEELQRGLGGLLGTEVADRKSTRLNSSHVKISYAVFCLKKK